MNISKVKLDEYQNDFLRYKGFMDADQLHWVILYNTLNDINLSSVNFFNRTYVLLIKP